MEFVPGTIFDIFHPLYQIFSYGYNLGAVMWSVLNMPFVEFVGSEELAALVPGFMADATLLEICFGPLLFAVIIYKIVASFIPLG